MPVPEQPRDGLESIDWNALNIEIDDSAVLLNVLARSNQRALVANKTKKIKKWNEAHYDLPFITTPGYGNEVALKIQCKNRTNISQIPLGYFSPVDNGFIIYPELVEPGEVDLIKSSATVRRDQQIAKFKTQKNKSLTRVDYEHPRVQALHKEHLQYLDETGLTMDVLDSLNDGLTADGALPFTEMDAYTQAAVCLRPNGGKGDYDIGLKVMGSLAVSNGFAERQNVKYINIAKRDDESASATDFTPIAGLVKSYMTSTLVDMTHDVLALRLGLSLEDIPRQLDTQQLGVIRHPQD